MIYFITIILITTIYSPFKLNFTMNFFILYYFYLYYFYFYFYNINSLHPIITIISLTFLYLIIYLLNFILSTKLYLYYYSHYYDSIIITRLHKYFHY